MYDKASYKELAQKIESGEYFLEAREWYLRKYMFYFIERSYLIVFILGILLLMILSISYYNAILPIKKSLPIRVNISSAADFSTRITYLGNAEKKFDINNLYIKYFLGRFVEAIESYDFKYDFKKLKINKNMIETLASKDILSYYIDRISIRNPDSITLKFRKKITRTIAVDSARTEFAEVLDNNDFSEDSKKDDMKEIKKYRATVNFTATETDKDTGQRYISKWQSKIILSFQTIKYNYEEKDFTPLNFKVLSYESKKID